MCIACVLIVGRNAVHFSDVYCLSLLYFIVSLPLSLQTSNNSKRYSMCTQACHKKSMLECMLHADKK